ncbi:MAG TPA: hypothetical protein VHV83_08865 [Armatimonadota bacterium]|nr:hypothetical protein [Armatimonadota bacterium]
MVALRIGLLAIDGITLEEVTPARERLEDIGAQVTVLIPSGGSILPVTGRYFPAAGGVGERRSLSQVSPGDFHMILLPDGLTYDQLTRYPQVLEFLQGQQGQETCNQNQQVSIVCTISFLMRLLERGAKLDGLANNRESLLSGSLWGRSCSIR